MAARSRPRCGLVFWPAPLLVCSLTSVMSDLVVMHEVVPRHLQVLLRYSSRRSMRLASVSRSSSPSPTPISPYVVSISKTSHARPLHPRHPSRLCPITERHLCRRTPRTGRQHLLLQSWRRASRNTKSRMDHEDAEIPVFCLDFCSFGTGFPGQQARTSLTRRIFQGRW